MALDLGFLGEEMTLKIRQGGSFGPFTATMVNPDLSPVNLTGCIIRGQIRKKAGDTVVVQALNFEITAPLTGAYRFWLTAAETAAMPAGATISSSDSKYVHDIELQDAAGSVHPLYYGTALVFREVTRV